MFGMSFQNMSTFETMVCNVDTIRLQHCNVATSIVATRKNSTFATLFVFGSNVDMYKLFLSTPAFFLETDTNEL